MVCAAAESGGHGPGTPPLPSYLSALSRDCEEELPSEPWRRGGEVLYPLLVHHAFSVIERATGLHPGRDAGRCYLPHHRQSRAGDAASPGNYRPIALLNKYRTSTASWRKS